MWSASTGGLDVEPRVEVVKFIRKRVTERQDRQRRLPVDASDCSAVGEWRQNRRAFRGNSYTRCSQRYEAYGKQLTRRGEPSAVACRIRKSDLPKEPRVINCDLGKRMTVRIGVSKPPPGHKQGVRCKPWSGRSPTFSVRVEPSQMAESARFTCTQRTVRSGSNGSSDTSLPMAASTLPAVRSNRRLKEAEKDNGVLHPFSIGNYGVLDAHRMLNLLMGCNF